MESVAFTIFISVAISSLVAAWFSGWLTDLLLTKLSSTVKGKAKKLKFENWDILLSPLSDEAKSEGKKLFCDLFSFDQSSGFWLGFLERLFSVIMFYSGTFLFLGVWFTIKLGSKWQTWSSIVKIPERHSELSDNDWLVVRRLLASLLSQRFLIGTLCNVLLGWLIFAIPSLLICYFVGNSDKEFCDCLLSATKTMTPKT